MDTANDRNIYVNNIAINKKWLRYYIRFYLHDKCFVG